MSREKRLQEKMEIAARYGQPIDPGEEAELRRLSDPAPDSEMRIVAPPKWLLEIGGPGKPPNAFHRFMQRIFFGFKWRRVDD